MRFVRALFALALCAAAVAGCGRKAQPVALPSIAPQVVEETAPPPATGEELPAPPVRESALTDEELFARKTLDELNAEMPLADVFFDFDDAGIRDDARASLRENADWLRRWTSTRITVEGHCDARGTMEYNLALGDRRAASVKSYLAGLGVAPERVVVVSRGEESPVCASETEECWQRNRRAHFVITAK